MGHRSKGQGPDGREQVRNSLPRRPGWYWARRGNDPWKPVEVVCHPSGNILRDMFFPDLRVPCKGGALEKPVSLRMEWGKYIPGHPSPVLAPHKRLYRCIWIAADGTSGHCHGKLNEVLPAALAGGAISISLVEGDLSKAS